MQRRAVWWVIFAFVVIAGCSNGSSGSLVCRDGGASCGRGGASGAGGAGNGGTSTGTGGTPSLPPLHKLDLLFVIDNSVSMSDKQSLLGAAVPGLLERLTNPDCVPTSGTGASIPSSGPDFPCPADYMKEFEPVQDIHVGIVSSSLGGHGGDICSPSFTSYDPAQNDNAHLIGSVRTGLTSYDNLGFLAWDPRGVDTPPGETDRQTFVDDFRAMVTATGETGCGYEATLESFYRFLVDPEPPASVTVSNGVSVVSGTDATVLSQRAAFLRPDSVVAVVVLSDENDCSITDSGAGWLVATNTTGTGSFTMPRATTVCATDPNSSCCRSCGTSESAPPTGCTALAQDPACQDTSIRTDDSLNLRCFDQKRRFGVDVLYPLERYVDGLRSTTVVDREGATVPNPLYTDLVNGGASVRQPGHVFVVGIIGVPWQDVATDASVTGSEIQFVSASDLARMDRWKVIIGDPSRGVLPTDPLMVESVAPRTGQNPILHAALAPSSSTNPSENPINGHEYVPAAGNDLQYACIFPLPTPRDCSAIPTCDCSSSLLADNRPLCNPPTGGVASTTQYFAKAYPGIRHLAFMKDVGQNAIVASICPKDVASSTSSSTFGYNPAMDALLARLRPLLTSG
jgi:hypothetical protein